MKKLLSLLFIIMAYHAVAQTSLQLPEGYALKNWPDYRSKDYRLMDYSPDIAIGLSGNTIETFKAPRKSQAELPFKEGVLVGTDRGEWGGKLTYKAKGKEVLIKEGNIFTIFSVNGKIYFIEGLAHLSYDYGEISELNYNNGKFTFTKVMDLPGAPMVYKIVNGRIFIATSEHFLIVNNWLAEYKKHVLWDGLYPNSIIVENDNSIYIGIRGGIAHIVPQSDSATLFTKSL